jgi:hypothetical protein
VRIVQRRREPQPGLSFALAGLALLYPASNLNPGSETQARRAGFSARRAVPIASGFLLLVAAGLPALAAER